MSDSFQINEYPINIKRINYVPAATELLANLVSTSNLLWNNQDVLFLNSSIRASSLLESSLGLIIDANSNINAISDMTANVIHLFFGADINCYCKVFSRLTLPNQIAQLVPWNSYCSVLCQLNMTHLKDDIFIEPNTSRMRAVPAVAIRMPQTYLDCFSKMTPGTYDLISVTAAAQPYGIEARIDLDMDRVAFWEGCTLALRIGNPSLSELNTGRIIIPYMHCL